MVVFILLYMCHGSHLCVKQQDRFFIFVLRWADLQGGCQACHIARIHRLALSDDVFCLPGFIGKRSAASGGIFGRQNWLYSLFCEVLRQTCAFSVKGRNVW